MSDETALVPPRVEGEAHGGLERLARAAVRAALLAAIEAHGARAKPVCAALDIRRSHLYRYLDAHRLRGVWDEGRKAVVASRHGRRKAPPPTPATEPRTTE